MKKIMIISAWLLLGSGMIYAQTKISGDPAKVKSSANQMLSTTDYCGIFLQEAGLNSTQYTQANKLFQDYMVNKRNLFLANRKNPDAYQEKKTTLFNTLKDNLATVLSREQLNALLTAKPASNNQLVLLQILAN
ncbi:hypothetical protein ACDQ55_09215 [Chitinophaga sp. 30R24]|uniref:hypothetical protein n=1 Tax=Chitinophaga sp. 30R24 TaxID=3248838 RepID=UPI003B8F6799